LTVAAATKLTGRIIMRARQSLAWLIGIGLVGSCAFGYAEDAASQQSKSLRAWAETALLGGRTAEPSPGPGLELVRQDSLGLAPGIPFSFVYGGKPSVKLLPAWQQAHRKPSLENGRECHVTTYTDAATGLEVTSEATLFAGYPAVEWVLQFRNSGQADTPILEHVLPLDLAIGVPDKGDVVLHHSQGSTCGPTDFLPIDEPIPVAAKVELAPGGGRSSNGCLPFFNLQWPGGGLVGAIGWSGQWAMQLHRVQGSRLTLQAGQQKTHLVLHPGEAIRTPRILLVSWGGDDPLCGHNRLRRLLLEHYVPRINGEAALPPLTHNTWFMFDSGNAVTEQNQLDAIRSEAALGVEGYWLDAGWFEGGWPAGAGSWVPKPEAFPRGLKPLGEAAHGQGMKFVVWFEPERVHPQSRIGREHAPWVLRAGEGDGLFNLGDPAARQWLTDYLSKCIRDWGIDIYRNDFNIDPLPFWQAADAPDRQGMAEIRYVEGLYRMWDELRRRHPGLTIDNCASGGRRIDLETISRSYPLWRSDSQCCGQSMPVQDQVQTAGLSLYVPLHAGGCWSVDPYCFRSIATTGTSFCPDLARLPAAEARQAIAEMKALRPLYQADFYPLLEINNSQRGWCAWQFDRPELGRGFAMVFRRAQSPYVTANIALRGLDDKANYEVALAETYQPKPARTMRGSELARLRVTLEAAPASVLVTYRKL
jgi:alpha-galactosidase